MDFEFSYNIMKDYILISGAMSHSDKDSKIVKFNGNPLILHKNSSFENLTNSQVPNVINDILERLKNKKELIEPILNELNQSIKKTETTLTKSFIEGFLYKNNKRPVIVVFEGQRDSEILRRLGINCEILSILCFSKNNDNNFHLKLIKLKEGKILTEIFIGHHIKNGNYLNLEEAHRAICKTNHIITYLHDPAVDVALTKCIFNFIITNIYK